MYCNVLRVVIHDEYMLIPLGVLMQKFNLDIRGIIHIGAHECEENQSYLDAGVKQENIYWIEAMADKVNDMKHKHPTWNIYNEVISNENGNMVKFNITNNGQSSSLLELGTHLTQHPTVHVTKTVDLVTTRLSTLIEKEQIDLTKVNFLNLDIQGTELEALKSMDTGIDNIDYIYSEVNTDYLYVNCALLGEIDTYLSSKGFIRAAISMTTHGWGDAFYIRNLGT